MSWEDKKTYWAWRGEPLAKEVDGKKIFYVPSTPTKKTPDYVKTSTLGHSLCIGVWDDDKYTPLHRDELMSQLRNGYWLDSDAQIKKHLGVDA